MTRRKTLRERSKCGVRSVCFRPCWPRLRSWPHVPRPWGFLWTRSRRRKAALKPQPAYRESAEDYADRMIGTIKTYIEKGYYTEASFPLRGSQGRFRLTGSEKGRNRGTEREALGSLRAGKRGFPVQFGPSREGEKISTENTATSTRAENSSSRRNTRRRKNSPKGSRSWTLDGKSLFIDRTGKTAFTVEPKLEMFFFDAKAKSLLFTKERKSDVFVPYDGSVEIPLSRIHVKGGERFSRRPRPPESHHVIRLRQGRRRACRQDRYHLCRQEG